MSQHRQHGNGSAPQQVNLKADYGHTETHIVVVYNYAIANLVLTVEQAQNMIHGLQTAIQKLAEHRARVEEGTAQAIVKASRG